MINKMMKNVFLLPMFIFIACLVEVPVDIKVSSNLIPQEAAIHYLNITTEKVIIEFEEQAERYREDDLTWVPIFKKEGMESYGNKQTSVQYSDLSFQVYKSDLHYHLTITHTEEKFNKYSTRPGLAFGWIYQTEGSSSFSAIEKSANAMIALGMKYIPAQGQ